MKRNVKIVLGLITGGVVLAAGVTGFRQLQPGNQTAQPSGEVMYVPQETVALTKAPTVTNIPIPEPTTTSTPWPTATNIPTPEPTAISTPVPTATNTPTPEPTATSTPTPTPTNTPTPTPRFTFDEFEKEMYVKDGVNVRDLPSTEGEKIGSLKQWDKVKVTGQCKETKWYRIEFDGTVGYVSGNFLVENGPTPTPTPTNTPTPTPTNTPTPTVTNTPTPKPTSTPTPKPTATPKPTSTPTLTVTPTPALAFGFMGIVSDTKLYNDNPEEIKFYVKNETEEDLYIDCVSSNDYVANVYMERLGGGRYTHKFVIIARESGTADITFTIYGNNENGSRVVYDRKTFTVTVELDNAPTSPFADCPYLDFEWKYGADITVQLWTNGYQAGKTSDSPNAKLLVLGTGEMDDSYCEERGPWGDYSTCNYADFITEVHISEGVTHITDFSLSSLERAYFPSTLKSIGIGCFSNARLTEVVLPEGFETLMDDAFYNCKKLTSITLPSTLKTIGMGAIRLDISHYSSGVNQLMEITIPKSVTYVDYGAFGYRWGINIKIESGANTKKWEEGWDDYTKLPN